MEEATEYLVAEPYEKEKGVIIRPRNALGHREYNDISEEQWKMAEEFLYELPAGLTNKSN